MKKYFLAQIIILVGGTLFSWYTIYNDFRRFVELEGSAFKFVDCQIPNPMTTPCFYGAIGFLVGLVWSILIYRMSADKQPKHQQRLSYLLIGGSIFAGTVNSIQIFQFYNRPEWTPAVGCSGQLVSNPFLTPCFIGATIFVLAMIFSLIVLKKSRLTI